SSSIFSAKSRPKSKPSLRSSRKSTTLRRSSVNFPTHSHKVVAPAAAPKKLLATVAARRAPQDAPSPALAAHDVHRKNAVSDGCPGRHSAFLVPLLKQQSLHTPTSHANSLPLVRRLLYA